MSDRLTLGERAKELSEQVRDLRQDLIAYRWTIETWMKRGSRALVATVVLLVVAIVAAASALLTVRHTSQVLDELRQIEQRSLKDVHEHRVRNEMLHSCLVELIVSIVRSDPSERANIVNPCPEPIEPEEIPTG